MGPQAVSFVERSIVLCPYLGESTMGGSTVLAEVETVRAQSVHALLVCSYACDNI